MVLPPSVFPGKTCKINIETSYTHSQKGEEEEERHAKGASYNNSDLSFLSPVPQTMMSTESIMEDH